MPVRGSTAWQHAILNKKVINHDSGDGRKIICAWDTCTNDGYECNKVRTKTHADGYEERYMDYVFCCERHKMYWVDQAMHPGNNNNLPPGYRRTIL
jgi:hypothetical protein